MSKDIILYQNDISTLFINKFTNAIKYNNKIYDLYDGKIINPPFFDNIIIMHENLIEDELKMIYNMTKTNGTIIFIEKYKTFFKNNIKYKKNYYYIKKKDNNNYIFNNKYRVVDFIIMGTQKGGTTALATNISKHPEIYIDGNTNPFKSEIHYFDIKLYKGLDWYKSHFNYNKKMVGDKTPDLMYLDHTFPYIQSINPYIKIILILRNPIERAFSSWKLVKKYFNETRSFKDAIQDEIKNKLHENKTFNTGMTHYLQKGLYYKQILNILQWFSKDNLLVLISENVKKNMNSEYNKIYKFLNVKLLNNIKYKLEFISDDKSEIDINVYNELVNFYKNDVKNLENMLNIKTNWM